ncbi:MAG TPA: DHH family phosphoesterase, partial [Solirubrobacteraceae bacterium]|nr:DHH family phosphoesterase [Solirubrobacteraceae bacterium]
MITIYVSGHRNPDTDAIGSAVGLAELKSRLDPETRYLAVRLGDLNPQTQWVLKRAELPEPQFLAHIRLRACDLMATEFPRVRVDDPIRDAGLAIDGTDYDLVPVLDGDGVMAGVVTTRALAMCFVNGCNSGDQSDRPLQDWLTAPCRELMEDAQVTTGAEEPISDVAEHLKVARHDTAVVVDDGGRPIGLLGRSALVSPATRRRVILVDHAERAQSVPGIEEAEIVEILDHHHIGSIETAMPVAATFDPVGSTATLVAERFRQNGIDPTAGTATLLLGAVLSDTVILNSPTTTERDVAVVDYLGLLLGLDGREFGREMFEASSDVSGIPAEDLVRRDAKPYTSGRGTPFLVAQIEVVGKGLLERKEELL